LRNPVYALAHHHIRSQALPHERTVEQIIAALLGRESGAQPEGAT
jgi:shikimate kinase